MGPYVKLLWPLVILVPHLRMIRLEFHKEFWCEKTAVHRLTSSIVPEMTGSVVLMQYISMLVLIYLLTYLTCEILTVMQLRVTESVCLPHPLPILLRSPLPSSLFARCLLLSYHACLSIRAVRDVRRVYRLSPTDPLTDRLSLCELFRGPDETSCRAGSRSTRDRTFPLPPVGVGRRPCWRGRGPPGDGKYRTGRSWAGGRDK